MSKPKLLDLFCGAGGASVGYSQAGFEVVGVDIESQPRYPFEFIQADAIEILEDLDNQYDVIHASPPCQAYSLAGNNGSGQDAPEMIDVTRKALQKTGSIYVIENVPGAPLRNYIQICGASFGLGVAGFDLNRHRFFESNVLLLSMPCQHRRGQTIGVYGGGTNEWHREKLGRNLTADEKRQAMGIDWMTVAELTQAIPPAYTKFIGTQMREILDRGIN